MSASGRYRLQRECAKSSNGRQSVNVIIFLQFLHLQIDQEDAFVIHKLSTRWKTLPEWSKSRRSVTLKLGPRLTFSIRTSCCTTRNRSSNLKITTWPSRSR